MQIEQIPTEKLIPYARNAKAHPDAQIAQIAASIKEFGWLVPCVVDADNVLVCGHGRVLGAQKLGMAEVPCVRASHLTPNQLKAFRLTDNQLTMNSGWDDDLLKLEIGDLDLEGFDLDMLGFDDNELMRLKEILPDEADGKEFDESCADDVEFLTCPQCGHRWAK